MGHIKVAEGTYDNEDAIDNVVDYVLRLRLNGLFGGRNVYPLENSDVIKQFKDIRDVYGKKYKRKIWHFVISFDEYENINISKAMFIGYKICDFFKEDFQIIFGVHTDTKHIHIHFAINTTSFKNGKRFTGDILPDLIEYERSLQI